jgi:hypothetical protein
LSKASNEAMRSAAFPRSPHSSNMCLPLSTWISHRL